ncbi:MAG: hypothetical protein ACYC2R_14410 [Burkholderiales bacterium]
MSMQYRALSGLLLDDNNFPELMRRVEDYVPGIYDDGKHIATIGIGANVQQVKAYLALTLKEFGVFQAKAGETDAQRNTRYDTIIQGFQSVIASHPLSRPSDKLPGTSDSEKVLQIALDAELGKYLPGKPFSLSELQAKDIVRQIALGFEIAPDTNPADGASNGAYLKTKGIIEALDNRLVAPPYGVVVNHDTNEYMALLSLQFNTKAGATHLIGDNLRQALKDGNRAEAWFEIRYGSNGGTGVSVKNGTAKRRYYESEIFGVYGDANNVGIIEAKQAYQMLQLHRPKILDYEARYGVNPDGTPGVRNMIGEANSPGGYNLTGAAAVDTLVQALGPAKTALIADLQATNPGLSNLNAASYLSTNLYLDPGRGSSTEALNPDHSAFLNAVKYGANGIETASADILAGEGGTDYLLGGQGDDILLGGSGQDIYYYRPGDGNDRIIDPDGGTLFIQGTGYDLSASGVFLKDPNQNRWTKTVGAHTLTLSHNSPWTLTLEDGSTIDLGDSFNPDAFHMKLVDDQSAVVPDRTIVGDLAPIDFDAATAGVQTRLDDLGNVITDPNRPEPGRADILSGGSGNDLIKGLGGGDVLSGGAGWRATMALASSSGRGLSGVFLIGDV